MKKLSPGDLFPQVTLNVAGGESLRLPKDLSTVWTILLFYRGFWWPYCIRLLAGYEERRDAFSEQGVRIIAAVTDNEERTTSIRQSLGFDIAHGITREQADLLGSWWFEAMNGIQPSEFILTQSGEVVASTYSNSPVGRMDPEETLVYITYLNNRQK